MDLSNYKNSDLIYVGTLGSRVSLDNFGVLGSGVTITVCLLNGFFLNDRFM